MSIFKTLDSNKVNQDNYLPEFFRISDTNNHQRLKNIIEENSALIIIDHIYDQLKELIKSLHPSIKIQEDDYPALIEKHTEGQDLSEYGVWVYYPWSNKLIHLLDEEEFVEVRTNRNRYKITREEQQILREKKAGIIGLSVGQSIALTMATERVCGELRLADFDTVELSNLNRIRTGVHNLGISKAVIAAREIAELDPFIKVKIYNEGITADNIDSFFEDEDGKIDMLVEVCDGLDMKIISRFKARALQIPVVMDTNDRGMIDIERFDLEPERKILHGLAEGLNPNNIKQLTNEEKVPYILKMINGEYLSTRLKASMIEVEQSINTWPQLASSVTLGGAITTDVVRRILLDQFKDSGRYYIDVEDIIGTKVGDEKISIISTNPYQPLQNEDIIRKAKNFISNNKGDKISLSDTVIMELAEAARQAPSAGNNQPWKWVVYDNMFFLFHDKYRSYSWGDFDEIGSHTSLGATVENLSLKALNMGMNADIQLYPNENDPFFTAVISFRKDIINDKSLLNLAANIECRHTNRKLGIRKPLPMNFHKELRTIVNTIPGADIQYVEDDNGLSLLGEIISACDRERLLFKQGHEEFFHEIRWTQRQAKETGDGVDLDLVDLTDSEKSGFKIATDWKAIALLEEWNKGRAFQKMSRKSVAAASSIVLFTMPKYDKISFINAGRAILRAWIYANMKGVSVHPMLSPVFFFNRLKYDNEKDMNHRMKNELIKWRKEYERCFKLDDEIAEVFLMKLAITETTASKTYRLPIDEIFQIEDK